MSGLYRLQRALLLALVFPSINVLGPPLSGRGGLPYHFLAPARPPASLPFHPLTILWTLLRLFSSSKESGCVCYTGALWAVARLRADALVDTLRVYGCQKGYAYLGKGQSSIEEGSLAGMCADWEAALFHTA